MTVAELIEKLREMPKEMEVSAIGYGEGVSHVSVFDGHGSTSFGIVWRGNGNQPKECVLIS